VVIPFSYGWLSIAAILIALLGGDAAAGEGVTKNFRVTLTLSVDGLAHEYGAVQSVYAQDYESAGSHELHAKIYARGEAILAKLPDRPTIVMLMGRGMAAFAYPGMFFACMAHAVGADLPSAEIGLRQFEGECTVPEPQLPWFVAIVNENEPETIFRLDPGNISNLIPGVSLVSVRMATTTDEVTRTIENTFAWLRPGGHPPGNIYGRHLYDAPNNLPLTNDSFKQ